MCGRWRLSTGKSSLASSSSVCRLDGDSFLTSPSQLVILCVWGDGDFLTSLPSCSFLCVCAWGWGLLPDKSLMASLYSVCGEGGDSFLTSPSCVCGYSNSFLQTVLVLPVCAGDGDSFLTRHSWQVFTGDSLPTWSCPSEGQRISFLPFPVHMSYGLLCWQTDTHGSKHHFPSYYVRVGNNGNTGNS